MLQTYLQLTARRSPDRVALVAGDCRMTYGELDAQANRLARGLLDVGVEPGDRVAVYLDNRIEAVVAIFGTLRAGAAFMMINPGTKAGKFRSLLARSRASVLILPGAALPAIASTAEELEHLRAIISIGAQGNGHSGLRNLLDWHGLIGAHSSEPPQPKGIDSDLASLLYTSGSTGEPKGVMLTHLAFESAIESIVTYLRLTEADVIVNVLPLSFSYGLTQLFPAVRVGAQLVLEKGMAFPHDTLRRMAAQKATGFAMVPTIATLLLGLDLSQYDLSSLRYVTNAGAGLPSELTRRFRAALPHVQLYLMYGQSECLRALYLEPDQIDLRPDSVGRGMPNQELSLVDERGEPVGPNVIGELVVRGAHVMSGYWELPAETAAKLRPGRLPGERVLHTGDLFRRDEKGYFYFIARQDDIIKSKGEKVSPRDVENAIYSLDGVLEVAVVGVPDPLLGSAVKAVVVTRPGVVLLARDVQRHCAGLLEDVMVPTVVEFRDALPKNERGKIARREIESPMATREHFGCP